MDVIIVFGKHSRNLTFCDFDWYLGFGSSPFSLSLVDF
jgi:hypothetical protein